MEICKLNSLKVHIQLYYTGMLLNNLLSTIKRLNHDTKVLKPDLTEYYFPLCTTICLYLL
jgi:hypothetical protein